MKKLKNFVRVLFAMIFALTLGNTQTVGAASDTVVIYEVYGGGDSNGAVYKYDYVVLKNVSKTSQSLDGLYLHKGTTKGAWFDREKVALKGEIAPGAYFVFRGEQPSYKTNGKELPRFDQSATMQIAQSKFAIALTKGSQAPSQTIGGNVIDLVGTNSLNETKPASGANATTSIVRKSDKDTDDNSVDFTTKTHNDGSEPLDYVNETDDSQPEDEKINIYFNPNGGKLPAAYDQYTADEYGDIAVSFERDAYHTIPVPTKEGYVFTGYDVDEGTIVDEDGNDQKTRKFIPDANKKYKFSNDEIILTAQWQEVLPEESTVTIDPNDGEMLEDKAKTIVKTGDAYTIDFEGKYKFYKDGYHFDGFDVEGQLEDKNGNKVEYIKRADPFTDYYPKSDVTLKVRWKVMEGGQFKAYMKREDGTAFSGTQYKLYLKGTDTEERKFPYGVKREAQTHKMSLLQLKNDSYTLRVEGLADDEFIKEVRLNEDKYTQNQADTKVELTEKDKAKIAIKYDSHFIAPEVNFDVIIGKKPVEKTYSFTLTGEGVKEVTVPGFKRDSQIKLNSLEREGYKFLGWKLEGSLFDAEGNVVTGLISNFDQVYYPGSDVIFTAVWEKEEEKATVTFAFNKAINGVNIPEAQKVEVGTEITLPEVNPEVKDGYSFLGWAIGDNKNATANLKPGDKITIEEDTTVMGIWEGAYGKVSLTFHTGEFIDDSFENRDKITKLEDDQLAGGGFNVENQQSGQITEGKKSSSKGKISINNGLVKGTYSLNVTAPEGYEIVRIARDTGSNGVIEIENGSTISLPRPEVPFNLTMVESIYVQVEKEEPAIELPQGLYIYEIYGGGGLQQSYYANDYVVLQNESDTDIDLAGINLHVSKEWRPEYAYNIPLSGTIKANDYFVIKAGAGFKSGEQKELPRVDLDLSGGKLYQNDFDYQAIGLALTMGPEEPNEKNTIDKVGTYYNNQYLVKPATSPHVDSSIRRIAYDDVNKTDFTKVSHRPYIAGTADHREPLWYLKDSQEEKVRVRFAHNVELTNNETPAEQNVWSGTKIKLPEVKEEEKFEFKGWDVDGDGIADKAAGEEFEVKENLTITGIWEEKAPEVKTINFVVDKEKGIATGDLSVELAEGEDPLEKAPKVEAKEGYKFVEWKSSEDGLTYTAIFEEAQKPVELIRDNSIKFEVLEPFEGDTEVLVTTSQAGDLVVIEVNGNEVLRKASNQANVEEWYEINQAVKKNDKVSVYIVRNNQFKSSKINKRVVE
ncbi:InlB B-repeat-containing protein [Anaerococcus urinomassiliensis]|uniref:InlB B-repeat-containing protein n=1 Tax=Anaerococcus urinomassiliensis TaxID=1745712 RepID=UPI00093E8A54|nr:InlB B-repeat-containing protein [Anaerococcus urinomassiliensis]